MQKLIIFILMFGLFINVKALELTDDITLDEDTAINEQIVIPESSSITINLNDKTLEASSSGTRKIINRGTLTIVNGTIENKDSNAYGIIDNYGTITITNVVFNDAGSGDGSTLKNRGGNITVRDCVFNNTGITNGNAGIFSDGILAVNDTIFSSVSLGAYPLIVNSGSAIIADATVTGAKGGMAVNSGTVTINGGTYTGGNYYGIWITNNGETDVTIKDGKFYGKRYGLYAAVDDGLQDVGDIGIKILSGSFEGETKAAALVNDDKSNKSWGMSITGGTFTTSVSQYVPTNYREYTKENSYIVAPELSVEVVDGKYIELGTTKELNTLYLNYLGDSVNANYLPIEISIEDENIAKITNQGISGVGLGKTNLIYNLHDGRDSQKFEVVVYSVKDETNTDNINASTSLKSSVNSIITSVLSGDESLNSINNATRDAIRENILAGNEITTELVINTPSDDDIIASQDEIKNSLPKGYKVFDYYDIKIKLYAGNDYLGNVGTTTNKILVNIPIVNNAPLDSNYKRVYSVIRMHDNVAEVLDANFNDGYLSFETDKFSVYSVIYKDELKSALDDVPKTGDFTLQLILIALSIVFTVTTLWYYKLAYEKE